MIALAYGPKAGDELGQISIARVGLKISSDLLFRSHNRIQETTILLSSGI
jgi:hypothetical protein